MLSGETTIVKLICVLDYPNQAKHICIYDIRNDLDEVGMSLIGSVDGVGSRMVDHLAMRQQRNYHMLPSSID